MKAFWFIFGAVMMLIDTVIAAAFLFGGNDAWMMPARAQPVQTDPSTAIWVVLLLLANAVIAIRHFAFVVREMDA